MNTQPDAICSLDPTADDMTDGTGDPEPEPEPEPLSVSEPGPEPVSEPGATQKSSSSNSRTPDARPDSQPDGLPGRRLDVDIVSVAGDWSYLPDINELVHRAAAAIAHHRVMPVGQTFALALALSDDTQIQELNQRFRGIDKPTNVLSFPAQQDPCNAQSDSAQHTQDTLHKADPIYLGDIMLSAPTIRREAREQQKPAAHHLQHLVIHGILHLLGLDHENDSAAEEMEATEVQILERLAIPNPYANTPDIAAHAEPGAVNV